MPLKLDSAIPAGPLDQKWTRHKMESKLINPANKRKFSIIVVGSALFIPRSVLHSDLRFDP